MRAVRVADDDAPTLPSPQTTRWTILRKAAVIEQLRSGTLTLEQARERYALSVEGIRSWERQLERHGVHGLRATRVKIYRDTDKQRRG
jgi:hypothetical protein